MNEIKITDKQARIIGQEIGEAFAVEFWRNINAGNPNRAVAMPAGFFLDRLGAAIGREVAKVKRGEEAT